MAIADQSGFDAIQPPIPQAPYAMRKIIRGPDGTPQVILVDMQGNLITDPSGYGILESGTYYDPNSLGITNPQPEEQNPQLSGLSTAKRVTQDATRGEKDSSPDVGSGNFGRSPSNNFGYIDKPGGLGFASMIPGPLGLGGKAVNAGINMNNVAAVNAARGMMGVEGVGLKGGILGTLKDNQGQVADVNIGGSTYATPVGFEALSPSGMTNMTPAEAAARARATGGLTLATPESIEARNQRFESEFGKPGLLSRMSKVANNYLDSMFGGPSYNQYNPEIAKSVTRANSGSNFTPSKTGFMDMLSGGSGSGGYTGGGPTSGPSQTGYTGGGPTSGPSSGGSISPGASAAIGRGQGGLY